MNNKQVFLSNIVNKFNNQNNSTDSKKIQEKATGYKGMNTRKNSLNIPSEQNLDTNSNNSSKNSNATNQLASNGLSAAGVPKSISDKIVKSELGQKAINSLKNKSLALKAFDKLMGGSKTEEDEPQEGTFTNLKVSMKVIRATIYVMPFVMQGIIFCCLFLGASQIFINSMNLGMADSLDNLDDATVEKNINDNKDKWDNEITDDHENLGYNSHVDVYVVNAQENTKYIQVAKKYNEADLSELNDFYGSAIYDSAETIENIDMNSVYAFYFKLYYIYSYYKTQYNVKLDLPLLMATLNVYTKDRAIIFGSNIIGYNDEQIGLKSQNDRFAYDKVHNYISTPTKGEYDIEVLAQHMVSKQAIESCVDSNGKEVKSNIIRDEQIGTQVLVCNENETYQVSEAKFAIDEEKYTEFLPEFLENKYFINNTSIDEEDSMDVSNSDITTCSLIVQGDKYYKIVNPQTEKCYVSGFYNNNSWGLEPKFYNNIMSLINDAKSHGCNAAIISGHRTYQKQAYFYNCYISKKCNNGNLAAKPGYSNHEYGIAADLRYLPYTQTCLNYYHTNAYKYGLDFPLLYASYPEDWHIEPINIIKGMP